MRSGYEYQIRDNLHEQGIEFGYESEVLEYTSRVRSTCCDKCGSCQVSKKRKYTPDFIIPRYYDQCRTLYVEAKGRLSSTDRSKMRDVKRSHPLKDIRFLFQKRSKKEMDIVAAWCVKNDFEYAFGTEVPDDWL